MITNTKGQLLRVTPFTASGTWTKKADVGSVIVEVTGGGGKGGNGAASAGGFGDPLGVGGSGGGGGHCKGFFDESVLTSTVSVTIGSSSGASSSSFGAYLSANNGTNGGNASVGTVGTAGVGGSSTGGFINFSGRNPPSASGNGGASIMMNGEAIQIRNSLSAGAGVAGVANTGGGGTGGAGSGQVGGAGGSGLVFVYEYSK